MIEQKPKKSQKNSIENNSKNLRGRDSFISSVTKKKEKSAAETASSILEELGVKKSSSKKTQKNNFLNAQIKGSKKKDIGLELGGKGISILNEMKKEKIGNISKISSKI